MSKKMEKKSWPARKKGSGKIPPQYLAGGGDTGMPTMRKNKPEIKTGLGKIKDMERGIPPQRL